MEEEKLQANQPESSGAEKLDKPKHAGGRPPKSWYQVPVQNILNMTAPVAARILQAHIERKRGYKTLPGGLQRACEYVIDHAIGKPKQKVEHSGGILTYRELAQSAEKTEKAPPPVLSEALSVAEKYQEKHPPAEGE